MVKSVKDFDIAASKLIEVYGDVNLITTRMLIEAEERIAPLWCCLKQCQSNKRLGEKVLVYQTLLSFLDKLKDVAERGNDFKEAIFHSAFIKRILRLVPVKVRDDFFPYCHENKVTLEWNDEVITQHFKSLFKKSIG